MIDRLDRRLLEAVIVKQEAPIIDIIRPFLAEKSKSALYDRLKTLAREGYVDLSKERDHVLIRITTRGASEAAVS